jgi:hypothetical protein
MKETTRIAKLFEDLYEGDPWIGVSILPNLRDLTAAQAARKIDPAWNTIWEITQHIIAWRENVLQRVQGLVIRTPQHNYIQPVTDVSEPAWQRTLDRLEESQAAWISLFGFPAADFQSVYSSNGMTYYEHIHGILQHDAYHLGQIVILRKKIREDR